jgi:hypothetical protein
MRSHRNVGVVYRSGVVSRELGRRPQGFFSVASRDRVLSRCGVCGRKTVKQLHLKQQEQSFRPLTRPGYFLLLSPKVRLDSLRSKITKEKGFP